ncbi:alpha-2-macroglobulin family protein [Marinobacterium jannaschii]|uniref:alpha-2-macroglobulin family protein n=1 Tax=Marinobacterium jannaschii TaxID=64970 RepID=UPI00068552E0|nr:alpha-2-macroglobulin [Marinobacterium jannaschii]
MMPLHTLRRTLALLFCLSLLSACDQAGQSDPADQAPVATPAETTGDTAAPTTQVPAVAADTAVVQANSGADSAVATTSEATAGAGATDPLTLLDISERNHDGRNEVAIRFSIPLDPRQKLQDFIDISAKAADSSATVAVDGDWVLDQAGKTLWFPATQPDTTYQISVRRGLKAANGALLTAESQAEIRSRHLNASVSFDSDGLLLTQGLGRGLSVSTVNVAAVNIDFFRIRPDKLPRFLREVQYGGRSLWGVENLTQWGELVYSGRYDLDPEANKRSQRTINVEGIDALQPAGLYLAVMLPQGQYGQKQVSWFSITDIGLHARFYNGQLDIYASSLASGKARQAVEVELLDKGGKVLARQASGPEGRSRFQPLPEKATLALARQGNHFALLPLKSPALDLSAYDLGQRPQRPYELFVYGPRDLYRPGEQADFAALLRDGDGRISQSPLLDAQLRRPDGTVAKSFRWQPDNGAYYRQQWPIPDNAMRGRWELVLSGAALSQPVSYPFQVEQFLPERMELQFNSGNSQPLRLTPGQALQLPVSGAYLYGAPAAGNRLSSRIQVSQWRHPVAALAQFQFGDIRETAPLQPIELSDIRLDQQGQGTIQSPAHWAKARSPLRLNISASLYESGGRPVQRSYQAEVWPGPAQLGIRPAFGDLNPPQNSRVEFALVKADIDGSLHPSKPLDIRLIREDRSYFWVYNEHRGWHYEWSDKEYPVAVQNLALDGQQPQAVSFEVEWGRYRLEVSEPASGLLSSLRFRAGEDWYERWQRAQQGGSAARPDQVGLSLDKAAYQSGDTARLQIDPPAAGELLLMVEGDQPLWIKRIQVPAEGMQLQIPVDPAWQRHDLYISALLLQPGRADATVQQAARRTPKRALGLIHLPLSRQSRRLGVELQAPEKIEPNRTLQAEIRLSSPSGEPLPQNARVTLAAVDVGVLSLSRFETPDPFEGFFGQRRYAVESRDLYHKVIEVSQAANARLRFGGDADLARGGAEPASDVQIVSLFSEAVDVDSDGIARVELAIPQFNGRLQLMALAFSDHSYGSGEAELTVASPLVTQLSKPRFLASGDQSVLQLDLTNLSGQSQLLTAELAISGPVELAAEALPDQLLSLDDGERHSLRLPVIASGYSGRAEIRLTLKGEHLQQPIERHWTLGVRPPWPALQRQDQQLLSPGDQYSPAPALLQGLRPETLAARLSLSSSPDLNLAAQLDGLLQYPYGCLEQTGSRAWPLIFADPQAQQLFDLKQLDQQQRRQQVEAALDRITALQRRDGGFGLWDNRSDEEHWLGAYVADFMLSARAQGYSLPQGVLEKALTRLQQYGQRRGGFFDERWSDNSQHYRFAYKAYAAYVLSRSNQASLGNLRLLFDRQRQHARSGLSLLHLALALHQAGDRIRAQQALAEALKIRRGQGYLGDYGSAIRDRAMMIHLLLKHQLISDKAPALMLAQQLATELQGQRWLSTQERNALFLAGLALEQFGGAPWQAQLRLGESEQTLSGSQSLQRALDGSDISGPARATEQGRALSLTNSGEQPLFLNLQLSGYGDQPPAAISQGISIERQWFNLKGEPVSPARVRSGDQLLVHLRLRSQERLPDVLLVDLLAAGFELENQNLAHAADLESLSIDGRSISELLADTRLKHQEYRDDRYVAALEVTPWQGADLIYLIRAVTPGRYSLPATLAEDMYRPQIRAVSDTPVTIEISPGGTP